MGKSSLVQCLSSGNPEVCNYPFTTRSIKMGHFFVNQVRHQVRLSPCTTGPSSSMACFCAHSYLCAVLSINERLAWHGLRGFLAFTCSRFRYSLCLRALLDEDCPMTPRIC